MAEDLKVEIRNSRGKHEAKRLRRAGSVPAVLYGHGEQNIPLSLSADAVAAAIRHGSRFVNLTGAVNESALIRELQWDTFGTQVLHIDFARVSKDERIHLRVPVEIRGEAPGVKDGGVVQHLVHEVEIETLATSIPEKLVVNIKELKLNDEITAAQIPLPEGAKLLSEPDDIVVRCVEPAAEAEEEAVSTEGVEPELIGRKAEEEGEEEES